MSMLKKSRKKNKKVGFIVGIVGLFTFTFLVGYVLYPYGNLYLIWNILPFLSPATTYIRPPFQSNGSSTAYGENIDMSQILPASQHYVINSKGQDLIDIAGDLGINLVRITNAKRSFNNNEDSVYTKDQWDQVLTGYQRNRWDAINVASLTMMLARYYPCFL